MYVPPECDLIKTMYQYGYEGDSQTSAKKKLVARKAELMGRIAAMNQQYANMGAQINALSGAVDNMEYVKRSLLGTEPEGDGDDEKTYSNIS